MTWLSLRQKLANWIFAEAVADIAESHEVAQQRRRLEIYTSLSNLTIGESICILNDIVREQIAADPALNIAHAQHHAPSMAQISIEMNPQDFIFLASSAIDHVATKSLAATPSVRQ